MVIFDRSQPYDLTEDTQQLCPIMFTDELGNMVSHCSPSKIQIQTLRPKDYMYWPDNQLGLEEYLEEDGRLSASACERVAKQLTT